MYGSDIAYFFGSPPKSIKGRRVISGEYTDTSNDGKQAEHPCPRKLGHVDWIIGRWTDEGEIILDPFLGSGTTAVACERLERRWIGIEISKEFCDIAVKRIEAERMQLKFNLNKA
jgi:DNA modification methylase